MSKNKFLSFILIVYMPLVYAQNVNGFEFIDRDISEILYSISMIQGIPIVPDDTVSGTATFRFAGVNFESAFDSFLRSERLYVTKTNEKWIVSRIRFEEKEKIIFLDACDVKPSVLTEKLSSWTGDEITFDVLPDITISLHTKGKNLKEIVCSIARQTGEEYSVEENDGKIHIKKENSFIRNEYSSGKILITKKFISEKDNTFKEVYSADIKNALVTDVLEKLFSYAGKQFVFGEAGEVKIKRALFKEKSFEETLMLLCSECNISFVPKDEIFYFSSGKQERISYLDSIKIWKQYSFENQKCAVMIPFLKNEFPLAEFMLLPDENNFLCFADEKLHEKIQTFMKIIDVRQNCFPVKLSYLKTSELVAHLPAEIDKAKINPAVEENMFFFTGSPGEYELLLKFLEYTDKPSEQIRYDLLVMQYQNVNDSDWNSSLSAKKLKAGDFNNVSASLGSVLDFNLDVVSAFGIKFASSLQSAINENKAHVFADTSLHGINGKTVSFTNTNTYRYRDNNLDPETGKPVYSGVTREIASGLKLEVTGWVSGDGMITCSVNASVSRQGTDVSNTTGNPPPTSEKIITTEIRGKSGEPVVLSGLIQNESNFSQSRTPFFSRIPLLGNLFKSRQNTEEQTKMVIYLVPVLEKETESKVENKAAKSKTDSIYGEEFCRRVLEKFVFMEEENE